MFATYIAKSETAPETTVAPVADTSTPTEETTTETSTKRRRLKYGTGLKVKRVVLLDGVPVGRGKPAKGTTKSRTVVYIPVDATYDVSIYGTGSQYNAYRGTAALKTVKKETYLAHYPKAPVPVEA